MNTAWDCRTHSSALCNYHCSTRATKLKRLPAMDGSFEAVGRLQEDHHHRAHERSPDQCKTPIGLDHSAATVTTIRDNTALRRDTNRVVSAVNIVRRCCVNNSSGEFCTIQSSCRGNIDFGRLIQTRQIDSVGIYQCELDFTSKQNLRVNFAQNPNSSRPFQLGK